MLCLWCDQSRVHGSFVWFLTCGLLQVLFLSLVVNFQVFSSHFPVTTLGLELVSGTYLNKLLFLWWPGTENSLIEIVHWLRCFFA